MIRCLDRIVMWLVPAAVATGCHPLRTRAECFNPVATAPGTDLMIPASRLALNVQFGRVYSRS
jgi:hypothetical protein